MASFDVINWYYKTASLRNVCGLQHVCGLQIWITHLHCCRYYTSTTVYLSLVSGWVIEERIHVKVLANSSLWTGGRNIVISCGAGNTFEDQIQSFPSLASHEPIFVDKAGVIIYVSFELGVNRSHRESQHLLQSEIESERVIYKRMPVYLPSIARFWPRHRRLPLPNAQNHLSCSVASILVDGFTIHRSGTQLSGSGKIFSFRCRHQARALTRTPEILS